jgi:hypothetical protein
VVMANKKMTKRDASEYAWAYLRGELGACVGGDAECMRLSEAAWVRGDWVGGVVWEACAVGRPLSSVVAILQERASESAK